jgi:Phage phiEco32-like COOH.NH2 ligase-type 2
MSTEKAQNTPEVATEVPVPKKRNYKGDIFKAKDLSGSLVPVERVSENIETHDKWYGDQRVPKLMLVKSATNHGDRVVLNYFDHKNQLEQSKYIPTNFELKVLTGLQGKAVLKKYADYAKANFSRSLYAPLNRAIGADPEIFVENDKGEIIPAFNFLKASSHKNVLKYTTSYHDSSLQKIYWDGWQAEFTVHPGTCMQVMSDNFHSALQALWHAAVKYDSKAKLSAKTLIEVPLEVLAKTKDEYTEFGCKPSFNVYGFAGALDQPGKQISYRSAGGHMHFGWGKFSKQNEDQIPLIVKALDAILAVGCVSMFAEFDHPMRRRYYGLAGEYRLPPHGLEYRTLSNAWLFHPIAANMVFDMARLVANLGANRLIDVWDHNEKETVDTIMHCDVKNARKILDKNQEVFKKLLKTAYSAYSEAAGKGCWSAFRNGIESIVKDPTDIVGNWILEDKSNRVWQTNCYSPYTNVMTSHYALESGKKI